MENRKIIIKAIIGFVAWLIGMLILLKVDHRIAVAVFLITTSIYTDLKALIKNPELLSNNLPTEGNIQ